MTSIMAVLKKTIKRECFLHIRKPTQSLTPLLFFILVSVLFPLAISPDPKILKVIGSGVIWVGILLANLLALTHLFNHDSQDGSLDQMLINPNPLPLLLTGKLIAHWFVFAFPIIVIAPFLGVMFHLSGISIIVLIGSLWLGTPVLIIQGAIVEALCVEIQQNGLLLAIILLPLYIPTLIFGSDVVTAAQQGASISSQFALLCAFFVLAITFGPMLIAFALRTGVKYS